LDALDNTHGGWGKTIWFLPARYFISNKVAYTLTAKGDMTSRKRCMVFEVKSSDNEDALSLQMLDRLACMEVSHVLKNALVFGATPDGCCIYYYMQSGYPYVQSSIEYEMFAIV
jgi:hypothetical protein